MNNLNAKLGLCLLASLILGACGTPGGPLPPSLELARPVSDLRAVRKGNTVYLTWSPPEATPERHNIRHPGPTEICRAVGTTMRECGVAIGQAAFASRVAATKSATKPLMS